MLPYFPGQANRANQGIAITKPKGHQQLRALSDLDIATLLNEANDILISLVKSYHQLTKTPEASTVRELQQLSEQLLLISGSRHLSLNERFDATLFRLEQQIIERSKTVRALSLRPRATWPSHLQALSQCYHTIKRLAPTESVDTDKALAFDKYTRLSTIHDLKLPAPVAAIATANSTAAALAQAQSVPPRIARFIAQRRRYQLDRRATRHAHFTDLIQMQLDEADQHSAIASRIDTAKRRAAYCFFRNESVLLTRYMGATGSGALVEIAPGRPVTVDTLNATLIINNNSGHIYSKDTAAGILLAAHNNPQHTKDPENPAVTMDPRDFTTDDIDCDEVTRLLNLERLKHINIANRLDNAWFNQGAVNLLSHLSPRLITTAHINTINRIRPTDLNETVITRINSVANTFNGDTAAALLDICLDHNIPLHRLAGIPSDTFVRHDGQPASVASLMQNMQAHAQRSTDKVASYNHRMSRGGFTLFRKNYRLQRRAHHQNIVDSCNAFAAFFPAPGPITTP